VLGVTVQDGLELPAVLIAQDLHQPLAVDVPQLHRHGGAVEQGLPVAPRLLVVLLVPQLPQQAASRHNACTTPAVYRRQVIRNRV
jgi:hypothetical protein